MNSTIKAVVFDMDGVIFDSERQFYKCWIALMPKYNITGVEKIFSKMMGANVIQNEKLFKTVYGEDFPYMDYRRDVKQLINETIKKEGLTLKSGVIEILDFLKENNYPIALATSTSRESVESHLKNSGLKSYFDFIVTGDEVEKSKPDPEIYLKACNAIGVLPQNAVAVEDSFNGIHSAYAAGMMPVMIPDMVMPDENIEKLLFKKFDTLFDLIDFLKK